MEGFRIYDREEQKDGKLKLFFVHQKGLAVSEVTFHADPTWLPVRIDYFHN